MKRNQALKILGLKEDSNPTPEEINKAFRKKGAKLHPDVNKEKDAEAKFKELNTAKQILLKPEDEGFDFENGSGFQWEDLFNQVENDQTQKRQPPVIVPITLTFEESVLGCKKTIEIEKSIPCHTCDGLGIDITANDCSKCKGKGFTQKTKKHGNMVFSHRMSCELCKGIGKDNIPCKICTDGFIKAKSNLNIKLVGGLLNGHEVRLAGQGNIYKGPWGTHTEHAFLKVTVIKKTNMWLIGQDVMSTLDISLLDSLKGIESEVNTVLGKTKIKIPAASRNKDKVILSHYGAEKKGNHIFELNVKYPDDIKSLIEFLDKDKIEEKPLEVELPAKEEENNGVSNTV